ncbi:probable Restriction of telomere capping protein 5 [Zygosaccharomyces bailii]|nr:probable Restriction of telomere capping protein 5 [Zygosaccharomyces bailii]
MGQGSSHATAVQEKPTLTSNAEILKYFNDRAAHQFTVPELISFKNKTGKDRDSKISNEEITRWLCVPKESILLREMIFNFIQVLTNFPLIKDAYESVSAIGLLKAIILANPQRCKKYVGSDSYNPLKLWFIALSLQKTIKEDPNMSSSISSNETFDLKNILETYDHIHVEDLSISSEYMLPFLTWLLLLTTYCPTNNCQMKDQSMFDGWHSYKHSAMNIMRSMNVELSYVNYRQFSNAITTIAPSIFAPLEKIMEHLLYADSELVECPLDWKNNIELSRVLTPALLAQLSTALHRQLTTYHLQKLYMGREHGFSMRSFQAKAFKWNAPSILFVQGKRIVDDEEYSRRNPRYRKFLHEYPRLKEEEVDPLCEELYPTKNKIVLAVYISEPWKVTNKEFFGGANTTVVQLSPTQDVFKASQQDVIYFNTIGGGIGVGNRQPSIKPTQKCYSPGNVSLTLDSALEFAVFRHVGHGGTIHPGLLLARNNMENKQLETKMLVQDVEVWGCGGKKELEEQLQQWQWEEKEAKRRQQINLRSIGEDRSLLEMAGLVGQAQSGGSI